MLLYSIVAKEAVFEDLVGNNEGLVEMDYLGTKVIASQISNNSYEIKRIISTSLNDYLNPELQPGTVVKMGPMS